MASDKKLTFDVAGALIRHKGKYLVCQRLENDQFGSMWEFPGGKVEEGENKQEALKREMQEELGIEVSVGKLVSTFEDEIPSMRITIYLYNSFILKGKIQCIECQDFKWLGLEEIGKLDLASADRKILDFLRQSN